MEVVIYAATKKSPRVILTFFALRYRVTLASGSSPVVKPGVPPLR